MKIKGLPFDGMNDYIDLSDGNIFDKVPKNMQISVTKSTNGITILSIKRWAWFRWKIIFKCNIAL